VIFARLLAIVVLVPVFVWGFFAVAGRWNWLAGWGCLAVVALGAGLSDLVLWRANPELLRQRATFGKGTKTWDLVCLSLFGVLFLAILAVGAVVYGASQAILTWCMVVNRNFEKTARIQTDRGHAVIQSGPYHYVRHPGYAATIVGFNFGTAFMLTSWLAFVPATLASVVLVVRTALEDRMLLDELPGYRDYAGGVRFRLVPGLW